MQLSPRPCSIQRSALLASQQCVPLTPFFVVAILSAAALIGLGTATARTLESYSDLRTTIARFNAISAHNALFFLSSFPTLPDFYIPLHRISCDGHILLGTDDDLQPEGFSAICNFLFGDHQWIQPSLSILEGGFEIRPASSLALPPFLLLPRARLTFRRR